MRVGLFVVRPYMHEEAAFALRRHIGGVLRNTIINDGWPNFESVNERLNALGKAAKKQKEPYLKAEDIFGIFYELVPAAIRRQYEGNSPSGQLKELLTEEHFTALSDELLSYIQSIPRKYSLLLPLPATTIPLTSVEFAPGVGLKIEQHDDQKQPKLGLLAALSQGWSAQTQSGAPYIYREVNGYVRNSLENQTARETLSSFKILLQQGIFRGLLSAERKPTSGSLFIAGANTHFSIERARLICIDHTPNARDNFYIDLPLDVSRLLERIEFSRTHKVLNLNLEKDALATIVGELFHLPALLSANTSRDSIRVRAASEWCFDSYASESETLSFLQICIGLEALLGDDAEGESLTKTLADRCAYLLGTSVKGRNSIRDSFRSLYKARSKIVHGNALSLAESERVYMNWGRGILEYAIAKELKFLGLDKN